MDLLREAQIELLVDVRSVPRSRTNPQFNVDALPEPLATAGIGYLHLSALTRRGSLMCNAIKWSFTAAYLFLLAMNTWGLLSVERPHFSGLLLSLGLPWTLFVDLGKINSLIEVSPAVLDARASD